jgi:hypothetical protein
VTLKQVYLLYVRKMFIKEKNNFVIVEKGAAYLNMQRFIIGVHLDEW